MKKKQWVYSLTVGFILLIKVMGQEEIQFTNCESMSVQEFEQEIAYFYGAKDEGSVAQHYIEAVGVFEKSRGSVSDEELREQVVPHLAKAYGVVLRDTALEFDIDVAGGMEFELIEANTRGASIEEVVGIMVKLYTEIFGSYSDHLLNAARLRTYLYQYKIGVLKQKEEFDEVEMSMLISMAKESERQLAKHLEL